MVSDVLTGTLSNTTENISGELSPTSVQLNGTISASVVNHGTLIGRDELHQHPMRAIDGLDGALDAIQRELNLKQQKLYYTVFGQTAYQITGFFRTVEQGVSGFLIHGYDINDPSQYLDSLFVADGVGLATVLSNVTTAINQKADANHTHTNFELYCGTATEVI